MARWWKIIMNVIINIYGGQCHPRGRFNYKLGRTSNKKPKHCMPLEISITNEQKIRVTLTPVTATGKPAQLDPNNKPTWEIVTGSSTLAVEPDGLSAFLISGDNPGDSQILIKADADLGDGIVEISDVITLKVIGALAASLGLTVGTPETK